MGNIDWKSGLIFLHPDIGCGFLLLSSSIYWIGFFTIGSWAPCHFRGAAQGEAGGCSEVLKERPELILTLIVFIIAAVGFGIGVQNIGYFI